jgi:hypothetical protein
MLPKPDITKTCGNTPLVYLKTASKETGATIYGSGRFKTFRRKYRDFWETNDIFWKRECLRRGVHTLSISTEDDPVKELLGYFSSRRGK